MPEPKQQMNVYVPQDIKEYVAEVSEQCGITNSEFVHIVLLHSKTSLTVEEIRRMAVNMRLYGEPSPELES